MKRLTHDDCYEELSNEPAFSKVIKKLRAYEDAEEQKRLIIYPFRDCQKGFAITSAGILPATVEIPFGHIPLDVDDNFALSGLYHFDSFYLTREEAESELKRRAEQ